MPTKSASSRRSPAGAAAVVAGLMLTGIPPFKATVAAEPDRLLEAISTESDAPAKTSELTPPRSFAVPPSSPGPAKSAARSSVLVLFDGRVIGGKVENVPSGYQLTRNDGLTETIPANFVRVAADSLEEAYGKMRDSIRAPLPNEHVELADWCVKQGLYDEAQEQIAEALRLDPNRRDARDLLRAIDDLTRRKPIHAESAAAPARTQDGFLQPEQRTATDVSRATTDAFVRRTQPLLLNKCGNAGCHGSQTTTSFQIARVRAGGGTRMSTLQNLEAILRRVDAQTPESSPLLSALTSETHRRVFVGTAGRTQKTQLEDWLKLAAVDLGGTPEPVARSVPEVMATLNVVVPASAEETPVAGGLRKAEAPPRLQRVEDERLLESVLEDERPDPFDPEAFNRAVHGASSESRSP